MRGNAPKWSGSRCSAAATSVAEAEPSTLGSATPATLARALRRAVQASVDVGPARLGVVLPADPAALNSWSGIPSGVCRGLAQHGVEVRLIDVRAPASLERAVTTALGVPLRSRSLATQLPSVAALRSAAARIAFRNAGRLDGVVQIGTGNSVPAVRVSHCSRT